MPTPALITQTTYAELLERCAATAFEAAFSGDGVFISKTIKGRPYWYFQLSSDEGRVQKYVGPETPELLERIAQHRQTRDDERERRALVSTLVRSSGLPRPIAEIGDILEALAKAGVFRLRGVLVGTVAFQTYSAMLGVRLPLAPLQTGDVDIAQFNNVSVAVKDHTPPMLDVLKEIDPTFRSVPHSSDKRRVTSYAAKGGLRVDFLTPNDGADIAVPQSLPALGTHAQPLRFLDYLIHDPEPAVILHNAGIYVWVPAPERYAIHKLIVARRRQEGSAKRDKDLRQAEILIEALAARRPHELRSAWLEAHGRGDTWRKLLLEGLLQLTPVARDSLLKVIGWTRNEVAGLDISFPSEPPRYDFSRDVVIFPAIDTGGSLRCEVSRETLADHYEADRLSQQERVVRFLKNRAEIEQMARTKYLSWPVEEPGVVLIKTLDVSRLKSGVSALRKAH